MDAGQVPQVRHGVADAGLAAKPAIGAIIPPMRRLVLAALLAAAFAADGFAASIYRCASAGAVTYQEQPCPAATEERTWSLADFPPVNREERTRLLQREAALDARLLKRAEIEAAERIAREQRRAQELELAAERERARATEPVYVVPVVVRPFRPLRPPRHSALERRY